MFSTDKRALTLSEIVGQKQTIFEFKNRSIERDYPQVMIFEGETGSGKTTLAFIIAKLINCKNPSSFKTEDGTTYLEPCNKCISCLDIIDEKFYRDCSSYDASTMGKEEVLKLDNVVSSSPMFDLNKILIIDEAQELSGKAKGSTLKLLEKKRKNVYFILCTMDKNSIPKAIRDRGQYYIFKKVPVNDIADYLYKILESENLIDIVPIDFLTKGLFTISESSDGSVRNAISLLERCIKGKLFENNRIILELGLLSNELTSNLLLKLCSKDKSIFEDLSKVDLKDFFYKSFKILNSSFIYSITNTVDEEWKQKNAILLNKTGRIEKLLYYFNEIKNEPYFNEQSFYYQICLFFNNLDITEVRQLEDKKKIINRRVPV